MQHRIARFALSAVTGCIVATCAVVDEPRDATTVDRVAVDGSHDAGAVDVTPTDGVVQMDVFDAPVDSGSIDAAASDTRPANDARVDTGTAPDARPFTPVPGVHTPLPIDPVVDIQHNQWLLDAYRIVLGREHDAGGYRVNYGALQSGSTREQIVQAFVASAEFRGNAALASRDGFVTRLYQVLLHRTPSAGEVASQVAQTRNADGSGSGNTWEQMIEAFYASAEYKNANCETSYYTLGAAVNPDALLLADLFAGRARMQHVNESEPVQLTMPSAMAIWDQKLPVMRNPQGSGFIGFTRTYVATDRFTISLLSSPDAVHFTEVGPVFDRAGSQTWYDPHIAIDHGVCPARYVMAMECLGREGASLCTSESTTPGWAETWNRPNVSIDGCNGGGTTSVCGSRAAQSASTGVTLTNGRSRYVSWTQVYDGVGANDPLAHTYSQSTAVANFEARQGTVMAAMNPIVTMMSATPMPWCTSPWDCNNRDKQDWKREGSYFYALYNGANYYRCDGTWGVSVARSTSAAGPEYTDRLPLAAGIPAERTDTCGISYPMLNVIDGELFVYYAYYPSSGGNRTMRARLVPTP